MNTNDVLNKLIAEIERRREKCADIAADERNEEVAEYYRGKEVAYDETSSLITSLQHEQPEVDLDKLVNEEFSSHSRTTEYGLEVTYNHNELYQLIKKMALLFNARKEE